MNDSFSKPLGTDVSGPSTVAAAAGTAWVSVNELLADQVTVHASEAVALLAEVCAVLRGRSDDVIPHAADVLVNAEGQLSIRTQDRGESDAVALARMLHSLFATAPTPAPLRLFVLNAISSERYQSVSAFAEALASYEVPGRNKLIQAVYYRWVAMRTEAAAFASLPPRPEPEQKKEPAVKPNAGARRLPRWAIGTVGAAVVLGGAAGAWVAAGAKPLLIPSVSLSVPAAIHDALLWLGASKPGDVAAVEPEIRETKRARGARTRTSAARPRTSDPALDPAIAAGLTEPTPAGGSVDSPVTAVVPDGVTLTTRVVNDPPASAAAAASPATALTGETLSALHDVAMVADSTVYSKASPDVVPPVMMTRQLTRPDTLNSGVEAASTIELLVDESGSVERVRLVSRPSPILATMLLSAAKTWKFRPALNDGRAVKYRLLLDVMTTRP